MNVNWPNFWANVILAIHVGYIFVVLGGLFAILLGGILRWQWVRNFSFRLIHFLMMGIVVVETAFGWECPLTTWEMQLREQSGVAEQEVVQYWDGNELKEGIRFKPPRQDFVARCLYHTLFIENWPDWAFTTLYYSLGAMILGGLILVPPRWPWRRSAPPATAPPV